MPITKKTLVPLNLDEYEVYLDDQTVNSDYFNISRLPTRFTGGRNSFLIGGSYFLQNGSQILIEIKDANGDPIFQTLVPDYIEGESRMITVEVYDTTAPGIATITMLGKAISTTNGEEIPDDWKNIYNVRWTKNILVDYNLKNTSPLIFLNQPSITTEEKIFFNINSASYDTFKLPFTASLNPFYLSGRQTGYLIRANTPTFTQDNLGGVITGSFWIGTSPPAEIKLPIRTVKNSTTITTNNLISSSINKGIVTKLSTFRSGSYSATFNGIRYPVTTSALLEYNKIVTSSVNIPISYTSIRLFNLDTVSGEIYKFRIFNKVTTDPADYKLIAEPLVVINELLVSSSISGNVPIGNISLTPNFIDNWCAGKLTKNDQLRTTLYTVSGSARYYNSSINTDKLTLSSSNYPLISSIYANVPIDLINNRFSASISQSGYFIGTTYPVVLSNASEYTLSLNAYYMQTSGSIVLSGSIPTVDIYLIGTGSTKVADVNPLGQLVGKINAEKTPQVFTQKEFNFSPKIVSTGQINLRFVINNGFWYFSNISLKPASDPQFSPDELTLLIPNTEYHNELLQYKVEFFDINNNSADISTISTPVFFSGSAIDLGTLP